VSFSPKKKETKKKKKTKEKGVKSVGSLHFIAALVSDNTCVQAHVSSLITRRTSIGPSMNDYSTCFD
jgi:hypothetical protein